MCSEINWIKFNSGRKGSWIGKINCPNLKTLRTNLQIILHASVCSRLKMTGLIISSNPNRAKLNNGKVGIINQRLNCPTWVSWSKRKLICRADLMIKLRQESKCSFWSQSLKSKRWVIRFLKIGADKWKEITEIWPKKSKDSTVSLGVILTSWKIIKQNITDLNQLSQNTETSKWRWKIWKTKLLCYHRRILA